MNSVRRAGLLVPMFSSPTAASWGIGEIGDLASLATWLSGAGLRVLQLLPLNEMARGSQSPYSAMSAMALDPIFISMAKVPEFIALGGEAALADDDRAQLRDVRLAPRVDHVRVRDLKQRALARAFERFRVEWQHDTARARDFRAFIATESWWLADYALYRAIHDQQGGVSWTGWPAPLRERHPEALAEASQRLAWEILEHQYLQWLADSQWRLARVQARALGIALFGDLPFMVDLDSADVWARQQDFRLDASVGVPPDAFSATGQDWGMPAYRWDAIAAADFGWLKLRARRSAALYDGYRVDHLVGFYRTYSRPRAGGDPSFEPADQQDQLALGERTLAVFREPGSEIIAEDLGVVPDFVRDSLIRLGAPGFKVFRWEREWEAAGQPFRDPAGYPPVSVATSGTHDTETMAEWWATSPIEERQAIAAIPSLHALAPATDLPTAPYNPTVRDLLLETLYASGSDLLLLPVQDVFGWSERINVPATVTSVNWTYRLPWPVDTIDDQPEARECQARLRRWAATHHRFSV